jgi:hypothetical protein
MVFTMSARQAGFSGQRLEDLEPRTYTTGPVSFSISTDSPGFQLLVRLLVTGKAQQGFLPCMMPNLPQLGGISLSNFVLLRAGSAKSAYVFCVDADDGASKTRAVLKLSHDAHEVRRACLVALMVVASSGIPGCPGAEGCSCLCLAYVVLRCLAKAVLNPCPSWGVSHSMLH